MDKLGSLSSILSPTVLKVFWDVVLAVLLFFVGRWLIRVLLREIDRVAERTKLDLGIRKFMRALAQIACYGLLIYSIADLVGLPTASLVAMIGSLGLTVGLALQGSLSNFASGVQLLLLQPFHVGDYITAAGIEGTVDMIGLFYTRIILVDNKIVNAPNSTIAGAVITNFNVMPERRIDLSVGVSYDSDLKRAKQVILDMLNSREKVIRKDETTVFIDELGDSAVKIGMRCWVKTPDYFPERWAINQQVKETLDAAGISIPFPQLDVHVDKE